MAIVTQYQDTDEYLHDVDMELVANRDLYGVIDGCAVTEDAADLTADLAAGVVLFDGAPLAVAVDADAWTIVADSSNERWSYGTVDSNGAAVLVSGDPAASSTTEPTKPEVGDRVWLKAWKVEAGQTIANDIAVKLDKRVIVRRPVTKYKATAQTYASDNSLNNDTDLVVPLGPSTTWLIEYFLRAVTVAAADIQIALDVPASSTLLFQGYAIGVSTDSGAQAATDTLRFMTTTDAGAVQFASASAIAWTIHGFATVTTSTTAGDATLQHAQVTSDVGTTGLSAGSWVRYQKLS